MSTTQTTPSTTQIVTASGTIRTLRPHIDPTTVLGLHEGRLVVRPDYDTTWATTLTACCDAWVTGDDHGLCCRSCYEPAYEHTIRLTPDPTFDVVVATITLDPGTPGTP